MCLLHGPQPQLPTEQFEIKGWEVGQPEDPEEASGGSLNTKRRQMGQPNEPEEQPQIQTTGGGPGSNHKRGRRGNPKIKWRQPGQPEFSKGRSEVVGR